MLCLTKCLHISWRTKFSTRTIMEVCQITEGARRTALHVHKPHVASHLSFAQSLLTTQLARVHRSAGRHFVLHSVSFVSFLFQLGAGSPLNDFTFALISLALDHFLSGGRCGPPAYRAENDCMDISVCRNCSR